MAVRSRCPFALGGGLALLLAHAQVAQAVRRGTGMEGDAAEEVALQGVGAIKKCKGDVFQNWWLVGAVPTGSVASDGTFCHSPCSANCDQMMEHAAFEEFATLKQYFQISDWGEGERCSYLFGNKRRKCRVVITDPDAVNTAITRMKTDGALSPIDSALAKTSIVTHWVARARQVQPRDMPACGCSFCSASIMPFVLEEAGYKYDVVGKNPECKSSRGWIYTCEQYLKEQECSCKMCFGGSDENEHALGRRKWSYLLGFTDYASDVAFAMRDLMETTMGAGTCTGDCMYDHSEWQGQK